VVSVEGFWPDFCEGAQSEIESHTKVLEEVQTNLRSSNCAPVEAKQGAGWAHEQDKVELERD